ncbi:hypothetical protein [Jiulongibacter sp. NS-SX5]|uniref:hypothetical protein n=1 Tax=Jiulongibacter sp. NS-SX5 TaxID=3463854 RepID=UPI004057DB6F
MSKVQNTDIIKFWKWWEKNDHLICKVLEQGSQAKLDELKEHFDKKVLEFGHFTWEIVEGEGRKFAFILSPNREFERLQLSKKIIRNAPNLNNWEFYSSKPVNPNPEPFKLYDSNLDPVFIDPSDWNIEIELPKVKINASELKNIDSETRDHAMDLVVTALLGEERRILKVKEIVWLED